MVGPSLYFCTSFYGESRIIGRAIAPRTLPEPTPMLYTTKKVLNKAFSPAHIEIDFSWAMLHSICYSFNQGALRNTFLTVGK